jgi:hypothetical protein
MTSRRLFERGAAANIFHFVEFTFWESFLRSIRLTRSAILAPFVARNAPHGASREASNDPSRKSSGEPVEKWI